MPGDLLLAPPRPDAGPDAAGRRPLVVDLWADQTAELGGRYRWVQVFENRGEAMGASNPHPHGQIWAGTALPEQARPRGRDPARPTTTTGRRLLLDVAAQERRARGSWWRTRIGSSSSRSGRPGRSRCSSSPSAARLGGPGRRARDTLAAVPDRTLSRYDALFRRPFPYSMGWHGRRSTARGEDPWQLHGHVYPPLLRSATCASSWSARVLAESQRDVTPEDAAARLRAVAEVDWLTDEDEPDDLSRSGRVPCGRPLRWRLADGGPMGSGRAGRRGRTRGWRTSPARSRSTPSSPSTTSRARRPRPWARAGGPLTEDEVATLVAGLDSLRDDVEAGTCRLGPGAGGRPPEPRDAARGAGRAGRGKLHTGRSRNDQVATDLRLWPRRAIDGLDAALLGLEGALVDLAEREGEAVLPGTTHIQPAQPVLLAHHLLAYVEMLERDRGRLADARPVNVSPLGAGALAGAGYPLDREATARELGFDGVTATRSTPCRDRDFVVEVLAAAALTMVHLSRFAEELTCGRPVASVRPPADRSHGQLDDAEQEEPRSGQLIRGRAARLIGDLAAASRPAQGPAARLSARPAGGQAALFRRPPRSRRRSTLQPGSSTRW